MNDAEYTIKGLRSSVAGNMPWTLYSREARGVVEHIEHLEAENERSAEAIKFANVVNKSLQERLLPALDAAGVRYNDPPGRLAAWIRQQESDLDTVATENGRLRCVVERHEVAFRHICDLLNHKIGSDPLHVAAAQAVNDAVMLRLQERL